MSSVCLYFQVHQPWRVKRYRIFDVGNDDRYFNESGENDLNNERIMKKVARKCYTPANETLLDILHEHPKFRASFSISGIALEQFEQFTPEVIASFRDLVNTGRIEILGETYYHSLAALYSPAEFKRQVRMHRDKVYELFGVEPTVFRNTELIYRNDIAGMVADMGYRGMVIEGADHILGWRSPAFTYHPKGIKSMKLLLKHYKLSDDIAFRFGEKNWEEYPLTAPKFAQWVNAHNGSGDTINLFMDYETFGEHQWEDKGIFAFLRHMPGEILQHPDNDFITPSEACDRFDTRGEIDAPDYVSWADIERDLSAWRSNAMQYDALKSIYALEDTIMEIEDQNLVTMWRRLQTSDHFYYMCTKWFSDGDVHAYFNPYNSPYEAFIAYMNALADLTLRVQKARKKQKRFPHLVKKMRSLVAPTSV